MKSIRNMRAHARKLVSGKRLSATNGAGRGTDVDEHPVRDILIVEDSRTSGEISAQFLRQSGWNVVTASSAWEAFLLAGQTRFDLAICDWRLVGVASGADVARELQQRYGTRIILIGGKSLDQVREAAADIRVLQYFQKPVSLDALADAIDSTGSATPQ